MIFLQASLFPTEFFLVIPHVILAHICGVHYLFLQIQPRYSSYSQLGKVTSWVAFAIIVWLAFYAIPVWIMIFGVVSKASVLAATEITIVLVALFFIALLVVESYNVYNHLFHKHFKSFSLRYFIVSIFISIGVFIVTFLLFGLLTKNVILTEITYQN
ncbi:hypothetical protein [Emticicia sp. 17c]|uniref:hypothetical protein n=1 Tax=Emticicia sp. 17c TaxID=3127704 RepID=UPI00301BD40A